MAANERKTHLKNPALRQGSPALQTVTSPHNVVTLQKWRQEGESLHA